MYIYMQKCVFNFLSQCMHLFIFSCYLQHDMFDMLIGMRQNPARYISQSVGSWVESWQLIWREPPQDCPTTKKYNPCKELISLQPRTQEFVMIIVLKKKININITILIHVNIHFSTEHLNFQLLHLKEYKRHYLLVLQNAQ